MDGERIAARGDALHRAFDLAGQDCGDRTRRHAGAASERFPFDAAFIRTDRQLARAKDLDKIHVRAFRREHLMEAERAAQLLNVNRFDVRNEDHQMRHTCIQRSRRR